MNLNLINKTIHLIKRFIYFYTAIKLYDISKLSQFIPGHDVIRYFEQKKKFKA